MIGLRPYAATPLRALTQVVADVLVVVWAVVCVHAGRAVHSAVDSLAAPGERLQQGAGGLAKSLRSAAGTAGDVPLVGRRLARPLTSAGGSAEQLSGAGTELVRSAHQLADVLGLAVGVLPFLVVLAVWLPPRLRFALRSAAGRRIADGPGGADLLALRALASQPLGALRRVSDDPVADWRRGDPGAVAALADLERRSLGLPRAASRRREAARATP